MIKNILLFLIILLCILFSTTADAISGGSISYECLGKNSPEITWGPTQAIKTALPVTVHPFITQPIVNNTSPICAGDSVVLIAPNTTGVMTEWFADSNQTISLGISNTLIRWNLLTTDTVYLVQRATNHLPSFSQVITIVHPKPSLPQITVNNPVCEGDALQLSTSSIEPTYEWTHELNGFLSTQRNPFINSVRPSDAGRYTLVVSNSFACSSDTASVQVVINRSPAPPIFRTNSPLCEGDSLLLHVNSICDTIYWVSPLGNQYTTTVPNLGLDTNSVDYVGGAWQVTCVNAVGCPSAPTVDTVIIRPKPLFPRIQGVDSVCIGNHVWLRVFPVFNATYAWGTAENVLIGTNNPNQFLNITTDTTFYLTITVNGCTARGSADIGIYPVGALPIPPGPIQLCEGDTLQVATITPAPSYQWTNPSGNVTTTATLTIPSVSLQDSGTYRLNVINMDGCRTADTTFEVIVDTLPSRPIISDNNPCEGDTLILVATGNISYHWTSSNGTFFMGDTLVLAFGSIDYAATWEVVGVDRATNCTSLPTRYHSSNRAAPRVPFVVNNSPICVGDSVHLWTPRLLGATSYTWVSLPSLTPVGGNSNELRLQNITTDSLFRLEVVLNGCADTNTTEVFVHRQLPAPKVPDRIMACEGGTASLTTSTVVASGIYYSWSGPAAFASSQKDPSIFSVSAANDGFYTLELMDTTGCISLDTSVRVIVNPRMVAPTISSPNSSICLGDSLVLIASNTCDSMVWINPLNQVVAGRDTLKIGATDTNYLAGDWHLICIDTNTTCQAISNKLTLSFKTLPNTPIITQNKPLCLGEDLNLSIALVSGASYNWYTMAPSVLVDSVPSITLSGITTDTVLYAQVSLNGCASVDSVFVQVHALPALPNVAAVSNTICASDSLRLQTSTNASAYAWTGPNGFRTTAQNPVIVGANTGFYVLTITDSLNCESTDSLRIEINALPNRPTISTANNVCFGDSIHLEGGACDLSRWFSPIGTTFDVYGISTLIIPIDSAEYLSGTWRVICMDTTTACISDTSVPTNITIKTLPANLFPSNDGPSCHKDTATLSVPQQGALTYEWSRDRLFSNVFQTGHVAGVSMLNTDSTFYVRGTTVAGCVMIDSTKVLVRAPLSAPSIAVVDALLCEGNRILLGTNIGPYLYYWTGPNGFVSNDPFPTITTVTRADSGWYTLHVEDSNGCVSPDTSILVVVNGMPYSGLSLLNPANVCEGDPVTLETSGTLCGRSVWVGPVQTQAGSQNQTTIYPGDSNYVNGAWSLLCYDTLTGCVATSNTVFVKIDPLPPMPIASNNGPICLGDSVELTAAISLGTTSIWYRDSLLINVVDRGRIITVDSIVEDQTFYVQQVDSNGCLSPVGRTTVALYPATTPVVYQDTIEVCIGGELQLGVLTNGLSYNWTGPNGYTSTLQNPRINTTSTSDAGDYVISMIANNSCISLTDTITVLVNPNPSPPVITSTSPICDGNNLVLDAIASCTNYQWTGPSGIPFTNATNPLVIPSTHPDYQDGTWELLCINNVTGCQALSNLLVVDITERPLSGIISNTSPVCIGDSVNLSTTNIVGVSYNWLLSNSSVPIGSGQSITVPNIRNNTTFYLEVTTSDACVFLLDSTKATVFDPVSLPSIRSNAPLCEGDTLFLSTTTLAPTYAWSGPNGFVDSVQYPIILGASHRIDSGLYSLSILDTNACRSLDTTLNVIINKAPDTLLITGARSICDGAPLLLNAVGTCDTVYWLSPSGAILSGRNLNIAPDSTAYEAGTWQAFCLDTLSGCVTASLPIQLSIQPKFMPVVTNNGPVCVGDAAILSAHVVLGDYIWFRDSLLTDTIVGANSATLLVTNVSADSTYYVVVRPVGGCPSEAVSTTVVVHAAPSTPMVAANVQICVGADIVLGTSTMATNYNWTGPNGFGSSQMNPIISNADTSNAGTYFLRVEDVNGCFSDSAQILVQVNLLPTQANLPTRSTFCAGDTLFLVADSSSNHCSSMLWIGPNGPNYAIAGASTFILPNDTNYVSGLWTLRCIDTLTGCFSTSNASLILISPLPDTQATVSHSPICFGGAADLSTNIVNPSNTYTWYSDAGLDTIVGSGQNVRIPILTMDTTFYLVISNNFGCLSSPIATPVTVLPPSNPPVVVARVEVCEGDPIVLTTSTLASAYYWTGPNGFVGRVQNPMVTNTASLGDTGLYTLVVLDSTGCWSAAASVTVLVNEVAPSPSITYNGPICETDTLRLFSSSLCGQSQWIGPNGNSMATLGSPGGTNVLWTIGSSTSISLGNPNYLPGDWYMVCIDTLTGCRSISDTIAVIINQKPRILAVTNSGPICANDTVHLSVSVNPSSSTITWHTNANVSATSQIGTGTSINHNVTTNTTFYVRVLSSAGCEHIDSTRVLVLPTPLAPSLRNLSLCEGETILLTTSTIASAYNWSGPNGYSSTLQNPAGISANTNTAGAYTLSIMDTNACVSPSSLMQVVVNPLPAAPNVSNTGAVCFGDSVNLIANPVQANAMYEWFHLNTGNRIGLGTPLSLGAISYADTGIYYVITTINGCSITSLDSTNVSIFGGSMPIAFAGVDQNLCGSDSTRLNANLLVAGSIGIWTSNNAALIINPNDPNTNLLNLSVGANTFYWTVTSSSCHRSIVDSVLITVVPIGSDTAFAGLDQIWCGVNTTNLAANTPSLSTGMWSQSNAQSSAGVVITNPNNPNTGIRNLQTGNNYTFIWSLSNGICGLADSDTVLVRISDLPSDNAFAGGDIIACGLDTINLEALSSSLGDGFWTTNSTALILNDSLSTTAVTNLQQDTTIFVWSLSSGSCTTYSSDTVLVLQSGLAPVANPDTFTAFTGATTTFNVLPNDELTTDWDIYINMSTINGQLLNLNNGLFDLILEPEDSDPQTFIYELCNPDCPNSCDTALVTIFVSTIGDCNAPNIFTPNGDGVNEVFEIPCLNEIKGAQLLVFNRWGDLVYETDQYENQWNGTHEGKPLPDGTYFYILKIGEEEEAVQGSVEIRR